MAIPNEDKPALRYNLMGHDYIIVRTIDGTPQAVSYLNTIAEVTKYTQPGDRVYVRKGKGYRQVII